MMRPISTSHGHLLGMAVFPNTCTGFKSQTPPLAGIPWHQ